MVESNNKLSMDSIATRSEGSSDFVDQLRYYETKNRRVLTATEIQNFELEHNESMMNYFMYHQQFNSIAEYETSFLKLKRWAETWSEESFDKGWVVSRFVVGLTKEIRNYVNLWRPECLQRAIVLAKWQELCLVDKVFDKSPEPTEAKTNSEIKKEFVYQEKIELEPSIKVNSIGPFSLISSCHVSVFAPFIPSSLINDCGCQAFKSIPERVENFWISKLKEIGLYWGERGKSENTKFYLYVDHFLKPYILNSYYWEVFVDCAFFYSGDVKKLWELIDKYFNVDGYTVVLNPDPSDDYGSIIHDGTMKHKLNPINVIPNYKTEDSEEVLVRDVLYVCQGIDGKYVKFEKSVDGYVLPDSVIVPRAIRTVVRKLCELGWSFRKVKGYISESMDSFPAEEDVGTVGKAFCVAVLQDELMEYYKLLVVLEAQSMNPIPLASDSASLGNYLSLRRLSVWFVEPMVKMKLMAVLVNSCKVLKGGAMIGAIHIYAQHGDPLVHDLMKRLLRQVYSPLFEMVRSWVLEGELEDIYTEFFVLGQLVKAESLWREGYRLHAAMLPSFISQSLAHCILRTRKSINFLCVCYEDRNWADVATKVATTTETTTRKGGLGYGETDALESLVTEATKRIDKQLMDVVYMQYKFKEYCLTIKCYLLLRQGWLESAI